MTLNRAINFGRAAVALNLYLLIENAWAGGVWYGALCLMNAVAVGAAMDAVQTLRKIQREQANENK